MEDMGKGECLKCEPGTDRKGSMELPFSAVSGKRFGSELWGHGGMQEVLRSLEALEGM